MIYNLAHNGNKLITFTIDGTTYQAIKGMTWGEWINSEYASSEQTRQCTTCGATESIGEYKFSFVTTGTGIGWEAPIGCECVIKRRNSSILVSSSEEIDTSTDYVTDNACND